MAGPARLLKPDVTAPPEVKPVPILAPSRDAEFAWLKAHALEYPGQWVALDGVNLLGSALRLKDLLQQLGSLVQERNPLFHRVDVD